MKKFTQTKTRMTKPNKECCSCGILCLSRIKTWMKEYHFKQMWIFNLWHCGKKAPHCGRGHTFLLFRRGGGGAIEWKHLVHSVSLFGGGCCPRPPATQLGHTYQLNMGLLDFVLNITWPNNFTITWQEVYSMPIITCYYQVPWSKIKHETTTFNFYLSSMSI